MVQTANGYKTGFRGQAENFCSERGRQGMDSVELFLCTRAIFEGVESQCRPNRVDSNSLCSGE